MNSPLGIDEGVPVPPVKRPRKDRRQETAVKNAVAGVLDGTFKSSSEAAESLISAFDRNVSRDYDRDTYTNRKRDFRKRIDAALTLAKNEV